MKSNNSLNIRRLMLKVFNTPYNWGIWLMTLLIWILFTENIADSDCFRGLETVHMSPSAKTGFIYGVYFGHFILKPLSIFFILVIIKRILKGKNNNKQAG